MFLKNGWFVWFSISSQKATLKTKAAFCINYRLTFDKAKNGDYCCMITCLLVV